MIEARFYEKLADNYVHCHLCPHNCRVAPGKTGLCRVRKNEDGTLFTLNYALVASWAIDPIEKKPLYHFFPGSQIFSVGTFGCNFHCGFCQNWQLAHGNPPAEELSPQDLAAIALDAAKRTGSIGIAYTYSEPCMWYEYVYDTAKLAHEKGLKNVLVTNGYLQEEPLKEILPYIDAMNIDVKAFTDDFYKKICKGRLEPVLKTVERAYRSCHVEITNLLVPGQNDSEEEVAALVSWLASLSPEIPLHFSRFFPQYQFNDPPTPLETLKRAREIALQKLKYVYLGNAWELGEMDTYCPVCGHLLVKRGADQIRVLGLDENRCRQCGSCIEIVLS